MRLGLPLHLSNIGEVVLRNGLQVRVAGLLLLGVERLTGALLEDLEEALKIHDDVLAQECLRVGVVIQN